MLRGKQTNKHEHRVRKKRIPGQRGGESRVLVRASSVRRKA
jgi:hypothetical protein